MNPVELERAIQEVLDGTADEATGRALAEVLRSDPAARELYYEQAELQQTLDTRFSQGSAAETATILANSRLRLQMRRSAIVAVLSAAAVIVLSAVLLRSVLVSEPESPLGLEMAAGTLLSVANPDAAEASDALREGSVVRLEQGSVELKLAEGSRALILAPATFSLPSRESLRMEHGTGWFRITKAARGFEVVTPELEVIDLGTEFGVISHPGAGDEVHVFKGRVRARSLNALKHEEELGAGDSRTCDPTGRLLNTSNRPWDFLVRLPESASDGLIVNGGFESGEVPPDASFGVGATASYLPGWRFGESLTVVRATSDGHRGYGAGKVAVLSSTSDVQVGFNINVPRTPPEETVRLYQTFETEPGRDYEVRFEMGGIFYSENTVAVSAAARDGAGPGGDVLGEHVERRTPEEGNGYNPPASFRFRAASAATTLIFTEVSESTRRADPVIDNVSVKPVR